MSDKSAEDSYVLWCFRKKIDLLPAHYQQEVIDFVDFLLTRLHPSKNSLDTAIEELKKEPINIDLLKRAVAEAEESLDIYASEVNNILTDIELIEKLIRYANRYRKDNVEFHQQLTVAEQYYREYRYNKTLEIIRNSLDKVEPGAYERIRNSVKPR